MGTFTECNKYKRNIKNSIQSKIFVIGFNKRKESLFKFRSLSSIHKNINLSLKFQHDRKFLL